MNKLHTTFLLMLLAVSGSLAQTTEKMNQTDQQGQKHGEWIKEYPNGQVQYRGQFEHGEPVGTFHRFFPNGEKMAVMNYRSGDKVYAELFNKSGEKRAEGLYEEKQKDSTWLFYNSRGQVIMRQHYVKGKQEGQSVKFFPNGDTSHVTTWQAGEKHGIHKQYFPNGQIKLKAHYEKGELEGRFTIFFPEGYKEIEGSYRNNLRHGQWVYYENRTDTARVVEYQDGDPLNEDALELQESKEVLELEQMEGKFGRPEEIVMPGRRRRRY
jgi:antitoxin component YwqK of YwqJK toxin-antitoxin module